MIRYSLSDLLAGVAICAIVLGQMLSLGALFAGFSLLLVVVYALSLRCSIKFRSTCTVILACLVLLPWLGVLAAHASHAILGSPRALPGNADFLDILYSCLHALYALAELPLQIVGEMFPGDAHVLILSADLDVPRVRPLAYFVFWGGLTCVLGASTVRGVLQRKKKRKER